MCLRVFKLGCFGQQRTWGYGNEFDAVTVYTQHTHTHNKVWWSDG